MNMLARALMFQLFSAAAANFALRLEVDFHADPKREKRLHEALEGAFELVDFKAIGVRGLMITHKDESLGASIIQLGDTSTVDSIVEILGQIVSQVVAAISKDGDNVVYTVLKTVVQFYQSWVGGKFSHPFETVEDMFLLITNAPKIRCALLIEYTDKVNNGVIDVFGITGEDLKKQFGATTKNIEGDKYELRIPDSAMSQYLRTFDESTVPKLIQNPMKFLVDALAKLFPKVRPPTTTTTTSTFAVLAAGELNTDEKLGHDEKLDSGGNVFYYVLAVAGVAVLIVFIIACRKQKQKVDIACAENYVGKRATLSHRSGTKTRSLDASTSSRKKYKSRRNSEEKTGR